ARLLALSQAEFVLASCLFAGAVLAYTQARKLLLPLLIGLLVLLGGLAVEIFWLPGSLRLRIGVEIVYHAVTLTAALQLIRFPWARMEIGPWLFAVSMLGFHLDGAPLSRYLPAGSGVLAATMLGVSMLLIVLDDSKVRTQQMKIINALTDSIMRSQQH